MNAVGKINFSFKKKIPSLYLKWVPASEFCSLVSFLLGEFGRVLGINIEVARTNKLNSASSYIILLHFYMLCTQMGTHPYFGCSSDSSPLSFFLFINEIVSCFSYEKGEKIKKRKRKTFFKGRGVHAYIYSCVLMVNYKYKISCLYYYYFW